MLSLRTNRRGTLEGTAYLEEVKSGEEEEELLNNEEWEEEEEVTLRGCATRQAKRLNNILRFICVRQRETT